MPGADSIEYKSLIRVLPAGTTGPVDSPHAANMIFIISADKVVFVGPRIRSYCCFICKVSFQHMTCMHGTCPLNHKDLYAGKNVQ